MEPRWPARYETIGHVTIVYTVGQFRRVPSIFARNPVKKTVHLPSPVKDCAPDLRSLLETIWVNVCQLTVS